TTDARSERQARGGVLVTTVIPNSPAHRARLQPGDVILKINSRPVREYDDLFLQLATTLAGRRATLVVRRDRDLLTVDAVPVKAPVEVDSVRHQRLDDFGVATTRPPAWSGLRVEYTSVKARESSAIPRGV